MTVAALDPCLNTGTPRRHGSRAGSLRTAWSGSEVAEEGLVDLVAETVALVALGGSRSDQVARQTHVAGDRRRSRRHGVRGLKLFGAAGEFAVDQVAIEVAIEVACLALDELDLDSAKYVLDLLNDEIAANIINELDPDVRSKFLKAKVLLPSRI